MTAEQRTLDALLAEIRAAGPCPEPEGERMTAAHISEVGKFFDNRDREWPVVLARLPAEQVAHALRQLRADLARLAAEVERQSEEIAELRLRQLPAKNLNKDDPW